MLQVRVPADRIISNYPISSDPWCFPRICHFKQQEAGREEMAVVGRA